MRWIRSLAVFAGGVVLIAQGCAREGVPESSARTGITQCIAVIHPTEGSTASGVVRFSKVGDRVRIVADVEGLTPGAKHGFHIHEFGDFSSPDAKSAGGHYNPEGYAHGGPTSVEHHAGDLGNLEADAEGRAHLELTVDNISIDGEKNPILGRGVVVHAGEDDLESQPTGTAGARIGFGVIGAAKP